MNQYAEINAGHTIDGYLIRKPNQSKEDAFTAAKVEAVERLHDQIRNVEELTFEKFLQLGFLSSPLPTK